MAPEIRLALVLGAASVAAYLLTPVAIQAAGRLEFFDKPKGYKGHAKPIPYLGGSAVLAAFSTVLLIFGGDLSRTAPLVGGALVLWAVGTVDDRRNLSPGIRVLVEVVLAGMLWATGLGWETGAGAALDLTITVLWILAVVNAFNLFDNMDGASSTMATVVAGTTAVLGLVIDDTWLVVAGAALAGSCIGFLPYNLARPQARIFLGDGGSMPIGFAIAAMVMSGATEATDGFRSLALGLLLVGIPATDTALVIISRRRKGISVLTGGRDHLTHRTRRRLASAHAVATVLGALQLVVGAIALVALDVGSFGVIVVAVVGVAIIGAAITLLEIEEDRLLAAGEITVPEEALDKARIKREKRPDPHTIGDFTLVVFAAGAALSPFAFGFYDESWWVPIGIGLVLVVSMGVIRRPQHLPLPSWLVLGAFTGVGLLALLSSSWADSVDQAVGSANRWLVIALALALALLLVRSRRRDRIAIITLTLGSTIVAGWVIVRMLGTDGAGIFLTGRLHAPLGYINAEATAFIMGFWLFLAGAERREPWLAGAGMAGSLVMIGLTVLSQSRGAAITVIASTVVVVAVLPGRRRRVAALSVLVLAAVAVAQPLSSVYDALQDQANADPSGTIRFAAIVLLAASAIAGSAWAVLVRAHGRVPEDRAAHLRSIGDRVLLGTGVVALVALAVSATRVSDTLSTQWESFSNVPAAGQAPLADTGSRLASGSGNRYEYWRVAIKAFEEDPLRGTGAGNFDRVWFADRTVDEDVRQPHSFELQLLSELGVGGGVMLLLFLGGFVIAANRARRAAATDQVTRTVAVAALGVPVAWLVHTTVDWQHLLPGTTAFALLMLATLTRQEERSVGAPAFASPETNAPASPDLQSGAEVSAPEETAPSEQPLAPARRPRVGVAAFAVVGAITITVTGASLMRQVFADHYRSQAFLYITKDPGRAIAQADRSLRLNADASRTYYAKAAALARLNRGPEAQDVLEEAASHDRTNPVTWALLGDLATRRGQTREAGAFYREALRLNPRDPGLQKLAQESGASADSSPVG